MKEIFVGYPFKTMWKSLITHLIVVAFLAGGAFFGWVGIMNLLRFASFIYMILMIVLLFTSSDGLKPKMPQIISGFFYTVMVTALVYMGYWGVGAAWFVSGLIMMHLTDEYISKIKEAVEKKAKDILSTEDPGETAEGMETTVP